MKKADGCGGVFIRMERKRERGNIKREMSNTEKKVSNYKESKIKTDRKHWSGCGDGEGKQVFITDGRIISYLFICHRESSFGAAKNRFFHQLHPVCSPSHLLANSPLPKEGERTGGCARERRQEREKVGVLQCTGAKVRVQKEKRMSRNKETEIWREKRGRGPQRD